MLFNNFWNLIFQNFLNKKFKRTAFEIEIFCNYVNVLNVTFDQFSASLLSKSIHFFKDGQTDSQTGRSWNEWIIGIAFPADNQHHIAAEKLNGDRETWKPDRRTAVAVSHSLEADCHVNTANIRPVTTLSLHLTARAIAERAFSTKIYSSYIRMSRHILLDPLLQ